MVPLENLWAFVVASVVLIVIPGPSVLFVIGRSLALGRLGGLLSVVGNALGMVPLVAAVALGVGAIVAQSVVLFTIIKFAGAAYLVYLGVQAIRHRADAAASVDGKAAPRSHWRQLGEGFIVGVTNPKTIAFFVAVLPQFVSFSAGSIPLQLFELGLVFIVLALLCDSVWALAASAARGWFARSPKRLEHLSATGGVMMIGLGGVLALSGNKH
ncbi:threonine/homoserine/homoserine lactone efflux protein [Agromyces hippuratus]|uniref:Threonine/homoserine/homoserine lactone efflux protein n=1 Tax=Agromyces hippuratus TaxID=286438 RepID=A0A852X199_9MICO|nr:LysE family translocator [Agromyces hippuratus]NYG21923.1 threonine/homoserine/homoserine lactone efflux protein [Agromyces hippuratus]